MLRLARAALQRLFLVAKLRTISERPVPWLGRPTPVKIYGRYAILTIGRDRATGFGYGDSPPLKS